VAEVAAHLREDRGVDLRVDDRAVAALVREGTSAEFGARELRRTMEKRLGDVLTDLILSGEVRRGDVVHVTVTDSGTLDFRIERGSGAA